MKVYLFNVLLALDLLINAATGGAPYETLSARAYLASRNGNRYWGWTEGVINRLSRDPKHCENSYYREARIKTKRAA